MLRPRLPNKKIMVTADADPSDFLNKLPVLNLNSPTQMASLRIQAQTTKQNPTHELSRKRFGNSTLSSHNNWKTMLSEMQLKKDTNGMLKDKSVRCILP